jgi:hypothetical protein
MTSERDAEKQRYKDRNEENEALRKQLIKMDAQLAEAKSAKLHTIQREKTLARTTSELQTLEKHFLKLFTEKEFLFETLNIAINLVQTETSERDKLLEQKRRRDHSTTEGAIKRIEDDPALTRIEKEKRKKKCVVARENYDIDDVCQCNDTDLQRVKLKLKLQEYEDMEKFTTEEPAAAEQVEPTYDPPMTPCMY